MAEFGENVVVGDPVPGVGSSGTTERTDGIARFAASVALNNSIGGPAVNSAMAREPGGLGK